jgi:predicted metalloendopeptidase
VRNVKAIQKIAQVMSGLDATTMVHYLKWHTISKVASYLPKVFVDEDFHFYQTVLSGTKELKPRWKRAMAMTETALGEALGKMYCNKYFDEDCKNRAFAIVESVRAALEERLKEVPWMTADATREAALKKMKNFKIKIGKNRTSIKVRSGDECTVVYFCPFFGLTSLGFDERTLKMTNFFLVGCSPNFFQGTPTHGSITPP